MPDIAQKQVFRMAGPDSAILLGAYSALTLCFGSLQVFVPEIVLENLNYDILIGTWF